MTLHPGEKCFWCGKPATRELLMSTGRKLQSGAIQTDRYQPVCQTHWNKFSELQPDRERKKARA